MAVYLPFFKFFPENWKRDTERLPHVVKGVWIDLLCHLWESKTRGEITWPLWAYATELKTSIEEARALLSELLESGTAEVEFLPETNRECEGLHCHFKHDLSRQSRNCHERVHLMSRRMMREEQKCINERYYEKIKKQKQRKRAVSPDCPPNVPACPPIRVQDTKMPRYKNSDSVIQHSANNEQGRVIERKRVRPISDFRQFTDYFSNSFREKFGVKYHFQKAKDAEITKRLFDQYNIDELRSLVDQYFRCEDSFVRRAGYTLGIFEGQINRLNVGDTKTSMQRLTERILSSGGEK